MTMPFAPIFEDMHALPYRAAKLDNPTRLWVVVTDDGLRVSTGHYSTKRDALDMANRLTKNAAANV